MFPVRYGLNSYINLLRNSVFKGLITNNEMNRYKKERKRSVWLFIRDVVLPSHLYSLWMRRMSLELSPGFFQIGPITTAGFFACRVGETPS
jgi:hypothetical protein